MIKEFLIEKFQRIVGKENVLTTSEALKAYSYDGTTSWIHEPDVVIFPTSTKEISERWNKRKRRLGANRGRHCHVLHQDEQDIEDR
ncbi:MAG: hypothetical protein NTX36_04640 [Proteobacteria bacterium]|nr:hypothetical protein [Pseudomonadota bacterium]